jgi:hypothetical protein
MSAVRRTWRDVLVINPGLRVRNLNRYYREYRAEHGIPDRCDNEHCAFHSAPLVWNGAQLPLILDHREGNRHDNTPASLRFLCPNCDSQLPTRGGANRGRVSGVTTHGYTLHNADGSTIVAATGRASASTQVEAISADASTP